MRERGMTVLNLHSDIQRTTPIDVFVAEPFDFDTTYVRSIEQPCGGGPFRVVDIETLIRMKEGRRQAEGLGRCGALEDGEE
jgi:hypothetical protein